MKPFPLLGLAWLTGAVCSLVEAQIYDTNNIVVQTFAGSGFAGNVDGQGTQTMFNGPVAIVADTSSNLFVFDYNSSRIRKISPAGDVSTFAGGGQGSLPGFGTNVGIGSAVAMTIDHSNTLYFVDWPSFEFMYRVQSDGYASKISLPGLNGGNLRNGLCADSLNNIYISHQNGNRIYRYLTNGTFEVFAGSGNSGSVDGNGIFTSFNGPAALAADAADNIYVWDSGNRLIRRINQNRDVVKIAGGGGVQQDGVGTSAAFQLVSAMCADGSGNLYLATSFNSGESIRKMTAATNVTTLAGSFTQNGYMNGAGSLARFNSGALAGLCFSQGMIFVADTQNQRIRQIGFNPTEQSVSDTNLKLNTFAGVEITGIVGRTYRIESSSDLSNWITEATVLLSHSPFLWIDPNAAGEKKFYRAFLLP